MSERPGPTGKFPGGKLDSTDEGQLNIAIAYIDGLVRIDFGTPTQWIGMTRSQAIDLARLIMTKAGAKKVTIVL